VIRHHPSETTLAAYAAGSLPEALAMVTATHLMHCPACQATLATLEATGGALLDELAPAALAGDALALPEADNDWRFVRFRPPITRAGAPPPHIRLDRALQFLIGDRLA